MKVIFKTSRYKKTIPLTNERDKRYSPRFNEDFIKHFDEISKTLKLDKYKKVFKMLIEKGFVVFYASSKAEIYFMPGTGRIYMPIFYFIKYFSQNPVALLGTLMHELSHFIFSYAPKKSSKLFKPLLVRYFKLMFAMAAKKIYKENIQEDQLSLFTARIIKKYMTTVDFTLDTFNNVVLLKIKKLEESHGLSPVFKKVMFLALNLYKHLMSWNMLSNGREETLLHILMSVHSKLSGVPVSKRVLFQPGLPVQEILAPSEIICLQSEQNAIVKQKVIRLVYQIIKDRPALGF